MRAIEYILRLLHESYQIIVAPSNHWQKVKESDDLLNNGWLGFYLPGIAMVILAVFIGDLMFESEYGFLLSDTLIKASRKVLTLGLVLLASNMLIYEISRIHHVPVSYEESRKIATYAMLPFLISTVVTSLFPFMDIFGILSFYSLYLVYVALNKLYDIVFRKHIRYLTILVASLFLAYVSIALLLTKLTALIIY